MNDLNHIQMLDAVERYIRGEMTPDERVYFESLRKSNSEVDQLVVEHTFFLQQMSRYNDRLAFQSTLHDVHMDLAGRGDIEEEQKKSKVAYLWKRYRRVAAIAASIALIVAISSSLVVNRITPNQNNSQVINLVSTVQADIEEIKKRTTDVEVKVDSVANKSKVEEPFIPRFNGTGFLIDSKGMMITNAHVVKNSKNIFVENGKGQRYRAIVLRLDVARDVAIIKIDDEKFKPYSSLPYGIRKTNSDLAESLFTLGYPRDEIVYGEGYLSARTGFNGDTLSCQISVDANPGNSGGPIFNNQGEVIGILSAKEKGAANVVFAVQSKYIYQALDELKKNPMYVNTKISPKSAIAGLDKRQQVKKVQDYIFMVKGDLYSNK